MPPSRREFTVAFLAMILLGEAQPACQRSRTTSRPHRAVEIRVAAASSLSGVIEPIAAAYQRENGTRVTPVYGATGALARQIEQGLPVDVFVSADTETPALLAREGHLAADTIATFARGVLVLYVRSDAPVRVTTLAQLSNPQVRRIAIANPDIAPFGRAAREALDRSGQWMALQGRIVMAGNVHEAMEFAHTGNADVALTARSVTVGVDGIATPLDESLHAPIDEALGVVAHSEHPAEARAFAQFVRGPVSRAILASHGFVPRP